MREGLTTEYRRGGTPRSAFVTGRTVGDDGGEPKSVVCVEWGFVPKNRVRVDLCPRPSHSTPTSSRLPYVYSCPFLRPLSRLVQTSNYHYRLDVPVYGPLHVHYFGENVLVLTPLILRLSLVWIRRGRTKIRSSTGTRKDPYLFD